MAEIVIAGHAGACFGVNRALAQVRETLARATGPVRTLGPLIHNPSVVAELAEAGVKVVNAPEQAAGATLVLRTHGVTPQEEEAARQVCAGIVDATCPFVTRVHRSARALADAGYQVLIVGEAGHPEVEATRARVPTSVVVGGASQVAGLALGSRMGVVAQTTQMRANLRAVIDALLARGVVRDLRVVDTICAATAERQQAAAELAPSVDVMIVIGGRASANTTHLARICAAHAHTHHIESADELDASWFAGASRVGVTAGASTPQAQLDEIVAALRDMVGDAP